VRWRKPLRERINGNSVALLASIRLHFDYVFFARKAVVFSKSVKHVNLRRMKTVSVRDLRQRWPETEKALQTEKEILVTRDSKPVAKLVRYVEPDKPRKRFDPTAHGKWQQKMSRGKITRWVEEGLLKERDER